MLVADLPAGRVATDDWDAMFLAVRTRLALTIAASHAAPNLDEAHLRVGIVVLECVEALGQLHALLRFERDWRHRFEVG